MCDGLWLRHWPYQDAPRPEPAGDDDAGEDGHVPGLADDTT